MVSTKTTTATNNSSSDTASKIKNATTFVHSVKVVRMYKYTTVIVKQVLEKNKSLKDVLYNSKHNRKRTLLALAALTIKNEPILSTLIRNSQILVKEPRLDPWLARVLIAELLWGQKSLQGQSKPVQTVLSYQKELQKFANDNSLQHVGNENKVLKPRYVRVNTLKTTVEDVIAQFRDENFILLPSQKSYDNYLKMIASLNENEFVVDFHVKDVLVFAPKTIFFDYSLYKDGLIALQDKASCLPPYLLQPPVGSTVLDMCAAPGMKTNQLACMVGPTGKVYALERNKVRYGVLNELIKKSGATNVQCVCQDSHFITGQDYPDAEYILVDPTCSGSGMTDRFDFNDPNSRRDPARLNSLAGFQINILRHALKNFPNAKRIIYSTCSMFEEENEQVVKTALESTDTFRLVSLKRKFGEKSLDWLHFGSAKNYGEIGESCMCTLPEMDLTNGFFIAMFERLQEGEVNPFFVKHVEWTRNVTGKKTPQKKLIEKKNKSLQESNNLKGKKNINKTGLSNKSGNDAMQKNKNVLKNKNKTGNEEKTTKKNSNENLEEKNAKTPQNKKRKNNNKDVVQQKKLKLNANIEALNTTKNKNKIPNENERINKKKKPNVNMKKTENKPKLLNNKEKKNDGKVVVVKKMKKKLNGSKEGLTNQKIMKKKNKTVNN